MVEVGALLVVPRYLKPDVRIITIAKCTEPFQESFHRFITTKGCYYENIWQRLSFLFYIWKLWQSGIQDSKFQEMDIKKIVKTNYKNKVIIK